MNPLIEQIANAAGQYAVDNWGQDLPKGKQLKLFKRHYDTALAALVAFDDMTRSINRLSQAFSEN